MKCFAVSNLGKGFLFLPTHCSICFMKSCHFRKTEEVKRKKKSETKYGNVFSVECYFLKSKLAKIIEPSQLKIMYYCELSIENLCVHIK